jgi:asparagine synthase (glutamine-hydrolysing)
MEAFLHLRFDEFDENDVRAEGQHTFDLFAADPSVVTSPEVPRAGWHWDGQRLSLCSDRFGLLPMFYTQRHGEFIIAPRLRTILRRASWAYEIDEVALAQILRLNFCIGERTPFKAIKILPPDATIIWRPSEPWVAPTGRYWIPAPITLTAHMARRRFEEALRHAMVDFAPKSGTWMVPLSGGRDSRHILFALAATRLSPACCVTAEYPPPKGNDDARIASQVAAALGIPHRVIAPSSHLSRDTLRASAWMHWLTLEHAWMMPTADYLGRVATGIYDGIGGDVLSAGHFLDRQRLDLFEAGRFEELADNILFPEGYLPRILRPSWYRRVPRSLALEQIVLELKRHGAAANPIGSFFFWNRTRRGAGLSTFTLLRRHCQVLAPFLHGAVYGLLAALPVAMFLDHRFHTDTISEHYPEFAHLPYEDKASARLVESSFHRQANGALLRVATDLKLRDIVRGEFAAGIAVRSLLGSAKKADVIGLLSPLMYFAHISRLIRRSMTATTVEPDVADAEWQRMRTGARVG